MARSCPRATDCRRSSIDGRYADQTSTSAPFRFSVSRSISAPLWRTAPVSGSQRLELAVELDSRRVRPERHAAARHRTSRIALNHGHLGNVAGDDAARRDDGAPPDRDPGHDQRPWTDPRLVFDPDRVAPPADDLRRHIVEVGDDHASNPEVRILADRHQVGDREDAAKDLLHKTNLGTPAIGRYKPVARDLGDCPGWPQKTTHSVAPRCYPEFVEGGARGPRFRRGIDPGGGLPRTAGIRGRLSLAPAGGRPGRWGARMAGRGRGVGQATAGARAGGP